MPDDRRANKAELHVRFKRCHWYLEARSQARMLSSSVWMVADWTETRGKRESFQQLRADMALSLPTRALDRCNGWRASLAR